MYTICSYVSKPRMLTHDHGSRLGNISIRKRWQGNKEQKTIKQKSNAVEQSKIIRPTETSNHSAINNSKQGTIKISQTNKKVQKIDEVDKSQNSATASVRNKEIQISEKDRDIFMFDQEVTISVKISMICLGWFGHTGDCRQNY